MDQNKRRRDQNSKLWVVTSYYNPAGYKTRRLNYHRFRNQLNLPLVTAEMSFDGQSDLTASDAEILLTLEEGDILWQKERLLNLAIKALPAHCEAVAWIDCDVLFDSDAWAEKALKLLDQYSLLHAFGQIYDVPPGNGADLAKLQSEQTPTSSAIQKLD